MSVVGFVVFVVISLLAAVIGYRWERLVTRLLRRAIIYDGGMDVRDLPRSLALPELPTGGEYEVVLVSREGDVTARQRYGSGADVRREIERIFKALGGVNVLVEAPDAERVSIRRVWDLRDQLFVRGVEFRRVSTIEIRVVS